MPSAKHLLERMLPSAVPPDSVSGVFDEPQAALDIVSRCRDLLAYILTVADILSSPLTESRPVSIFHSSVESILELQVFVDLFDLTTHIESINNDISIILQLVQLPHPLEAGQTFQLALKLGKELRIISPLLAVKVSHPTAIQQAS